MISVHVYDEPDKITVTQLDCVVASYRKRGFPNEDAFVRFVVEVLDQLGHKVEVA